MSRVHGGFARRPPIIVTPIASPDMQCDSRRGRMHSVDSDGAGACSLLSAVCNRFAEFKPRPDPSNADASHGAFGVSAADGRCAPRWWPQCHGRFIGHTDHRRLLVEPTPSECLRTTSGPGSQEAGVVQYWPRAVRLHSVRSRGRPTEPSDPPERHEHLESFTRSPLISPAWSSNDPELCLVSHSNSRLTSCPLSPIFKFYFFSSCG